MLGIWVIDFNQPESTFWVATIPQFRAYYSAWEQRENRAYARAGTIAASIINTTRTKRSDKLWQPVDVFPHLRPKPRRRSPEEIKRMFAAYFYDAQGIDILEAPNG